MNNHRSCNWNDRILHPGIVIPAKHLRDVAYGLQRALLESLRLRTAAFKGAIGNLHILHHSLRLEIPGAAQLACMHNLRSCDNKDNILHPGTVIPAKRIRYFA